MPTVHPPDSGQSVDNYEIKAVATNRSSSITTSVSIRAVKLNAGGTRVDGAQFFVKEGRNVSVLTLPPGTSVEMSVAGHQVIREVGLDFPTSALVELADLVTEQVTAFEAVSFH